MGDTGEYTCTVTLTPTGSPFHGPVTEAEEHVTTWGGRNKMGNLGLWISS